MSWLGGVGGEGGGVVEGGGRGACIWRGSWKVPEVGKEQVICVLRYVQAHLYSEPFIFLAGGGRSIFEQ